MNSFIVNSSDLMDKNKNPNLSLSPSDILKNKKIRKQELINQIRLKERELLNLNSQVEEIEELEKATALKSKGFSKVLYLLNQEFQSNSGRTEQYSEFHRIFKKEFTNLLKPYIKRIEFSKPNHFDVTGFFELNDNFSEKETKIYYFSLGDLRWDKGTLLIRTAKDFKDYTGGSNNYIPFEEDFENRIIEFLKNDKGWI